MNFLTACSLYASELKTDDGSGIGFHIRLADYTKEKFRSAASLGIGDPVGGPAATTPALRDCFKQQWLESQSPEATIICVLGPIGFGKSTLGEFVATELNRRAGAEKFVHIDGDVLLFPPARTTGAETRQDQEKLVLSLGAERQACSLWSVVAALHLGRTPVISCGGGVLFSNSFGPRGKNSEPALAVRRAASNAIGTEVKIVAVVPEDLDRVYADLKTVRETVLWRCRQGIWAPSGGMTAHKFADFIAKKSVANQDFAELLAAQADEVFEYRSSELADVALATNIQNAVVENKFWTGSAGIGPGAATSEERELHVFQTRVLAKTSASEKTGHVTLKYGPHRVRIEQHAQSRVEGAVVPRGRGEPSDVQFPHDGTTTAARFVRELYGPNCALPATVPGIIVTLKKAEGRGKMGNVSCVVIPNHETQWKKIRRTFGVRDPRGAGKKRASPTAKTNGTTSNGKGASTTAVEAPSKNTDSKTLVPVDGPPSSVGPDEPPLRRAQTVSATQDPVTRRSLLERIPEFVRSIVTRFCGSPPTDSLFGRVISVVVPPMPPSSDEQALRTNELGDPLLAEPADNPAPSNGLFKAKSSPPLLGAGAFKSQTTSVTVPTSDLRTAGDDEEFLRTLAGGLRWRYSEEEDPWSSQSSVGSGAGSTEGQLRDKTLRSFFSCVDEDAGIDQLLTHVTINAGPHQAKDMRFVAKAVLEGWPRLELEPQKKGPVLVYDMGQATMEMTEITFVSTFCLPRGVM